MFSLDIYQQKEVKEICLNLQDQFGFNVNFILAAMWAAAWQQEIKLSHFKFFQQQLWSIETEIVRPLRHARRAVSADLFSFPPEEKAVFKEQLLAVEIAAEKLFQQQLEALILNQFSEMKNQVQSVKKVSLNSEDFKKLAVTNLLQYALLINNKAATASLPPILKQMVNKITI